MKQVKTLLTAIERFQNANNHDADLRTLLNSYKVTLGALKDRGNISLLEQGGVSKIAESLYQRRVINYKTFSQCLNF